MKNKAAAVVVWYNPETKRAIQNIESYIEQVEIVYVIDNSDNPIAQELIDYISVQASIVYMPLGENKGIAYALNTGARKAIEAGYEWFLTMDQDSQATSGMVAILYNFALSQQIENIGIVAAQPNTPTRAGQKTELYTLMQIVITSGNLVNSRAYEQAGGFIDKLFIDYVDFVFSLAVHTAGYKIVQVNNAVLKHNLGDITPKSFLGIRMYPTHHSPVRRYYIARNRCYMQTVYEKAFPEYIAFDRREYFKMWIKILLYEKNKCQSWKMATRGRHDFRKGIFGKFNS